MEDHSLNTDETEEFHTPYDYEQQQKNQKNRYKFPWYDINKWEHITEEINQWRSNYGKIDDVSERRKALNVLLSKTGTRELKGLKAVSENFFKEPLNLMLQKIIEGPTIFIEGLSCTEINKPSTIQLTKEKTFVIMSLSFFGLCDYRFTDLLCNSEYAQCMANYFVRTCSECSANPNWMQKQMKIERRVLTREQTPNWENSTKTMRGLKVFEQKIGIEDFRNCCQVNFADPYPGGTLPSSHGDIVQEEILFLVYPELFITCLLVPKIDTREAILVEGLTRTNKYTGYQWNFAYAGNFDTDTNDISILHMDALPGGEHDKRSLERELNKAYIAFTADIKNKPIGTGHWGCGAFGGNHQRKAVLQLIAAAEAGVDLQYATYGTKHVNGLAQFHAELVQHKVTAGQLYSALLLRLGWGWTREDMFRGIIRDFLDTNKHSDEE